MKISAPENTSNLFVRYKPGRRFYVFVVSLIVASGFWLLNALNKNYSEVVTIYIKYINLSENRAFSPIPYDNIKIDLTGDGFSLMQLKNTAESDTVIIDLNQLDYQIVGNKNRAQIPTSLIVSELKGKLNNNVNISRVSRDSIEVYTELGEFKELQIKPTFSIQVKKGMVLKRPVYVTPSTVKTHGPLSILNETLFLETEHIQLKDVSENVSVKLNLAYNPRLLQPEKTSVTLIAEIEPLTEGEIEVPIHVSGVPTDKRVRLLPNQVIVKYSTGLSHYDLIEADLFDVVVRYEDVLRNSTKVPVYLRTIPSYINLIQIAPEQVGYLKMDIIE